MLTDEILLTIIGVLGGSIIILAIWVIHLYQRLSRLMKGGSGTSLEGILANLVEGSNEHRIFSNSLSERIEALEEKALETVGRVGTVRFNAFEDTGGHQSFATAFLNKKGDGLLLSGIHGRDRMTVYAKPIEKFSSSYDLSEEEKEAIKKTHSK